MSLSCKYGHILLVGLLVISSFPLPKAGAAEITDVIDAADKRWIGGRDNNTKTKDDPFDMNIGVSFGQHFKNGIISRERSSYYPSLVEEMAYKYQDMIMNFDVAIGMYHDLALYVSIPLVLRQKHHYAFAEGVSTSNSSIYRGSSDPKNLIEFDPADGFDFIHGTGIGNILFSLKWSPLNDERDSSVATWTIGVTYEAPTASLYDPTSLDVLTKQQLNSHTSEGLAVGDKAHRLTFSIAMSRRMFLPKEYALNPDVNRRGFIDPYFLIFYSLPIASSNAVPADPKHKAYDGSITQYQPPHIGGFKTGMEIVAYENVSQGRKLAFDIGVYGTYISEGRGYTPITDAIRELTYFENYMQVGGHFNIVAKLAEYVGLTAGITIGHETAHFITMENSGEDKDGNGQTGDPADYNSPYWSSEMDQIGKRMRIEQILDFSYNVGLQVTF